MLFRERPLEPGPIDAAIYTPRPQLESALIPTLRQGRNVLLIGDAGAGKTTLMRRAKARLDEDGKATTWINAALTELPQDLLLALIAQIGAGKPRLREPVQGGPHSHLLSLTRDLAAYPPSTIFIDGLSDTDLAFDLFGRLRDELWASGHSWLVAVRPKDAAQLRQPPAEAFWSTVIEIPPLDQKEVNEFLAHGLEPEERLRLRSDRPLAGLHPRLLIREVEEALGADPGEKRARVGVLVDRAGEVGRSEGLAMAELFALGRPASAHDPELLERLGWSRAYTQRILSRLEQEGLLRSVSEVSHERSGRPRKLYEPNPNPSR